VFALQSVSEKIKVAQSLETYLRTGEPIQVVSQEGLLVPYEIQKKDTVGGCSGIGPRTEKTYKDYLERIPGEPFNPSDFEKKHQDRIIHLGCTLNFMEKVILLDPKEQYVLGRLAAEAVTDMKEKAKPIERLMEGLSEEEYVKFISFIPPQKRWFDLSVQEQEEILSQIPSVKHNYSWETVKSIKYACSSDCIGLRQRTHWATELTTALYEIIFSPKGIDGVDIYLRKPKTKEEIEKGIASFKERQKMYKDFENLLGIL